MYKMGYFQEVAEPIFFPLLTQFSFVRIIPSEEENIILEGVAVIQLKMILKISFVWNFGNVKLFG